MSGLLRNLPNTRVVAMSLAAVALLAASGCPAILPFAGHGIEAEPMARIQERIARSTFLGMAAEDAALQDMLDWAESAHGADGVDIAGIMEDDNGVELVWARMNGGVAGEPPPVVVRHCLNGDCVSAVQTYVGGEQEIVWNTPDGPIPVRAVAQPFLLKDYYEASGRSYIATPRPELAPPPNAKVHPPEIVAPVAALGKPPVLKATDKFRAFSAFGSHLSSVPRSLSGLVDIMIKAGCTNAEAVYNAGTAEVTHALSSLGSADVFVLYAHGANSVSRGRVIGMTVSDGPIYWSHDALYHEDQFVAQLGQNIFGGPGLIFLAGCATGGMVPALDAPDRIVIGFSKDHYNQNIYNATKLFFEQYTGGATLGEAIQTVNDSPGMKNSDVALVVNAGADLSRRFKESAETTPDAEIAVTAFRNPDGTTGIDAGKAVIKVSGNLASLQISWSGVRAFSLLVDQVGTEPVEYGLEPADRDSFSYLTSPIAYGNFAVAGYRAPSSVPSVAAPLSFGRYVVTVRGDSSTSLTIVYATLEFEFR